MLSFPGRRKIRKRTALQADPGVKGYFFAVGDLSSSAAVSCIDVGRPVPDTMSNLPTSLFVYLNIGIAKSVKQRHTEVCLIGFVSLCLVTPSMLYLTRAMQGLKRSTAWTDSIVLPIPDYVPIVHVLPSLRAYLYEDHHLMSRCDPTASSSIPAHKTLCGSSYTLTLYRYY